MTSNEFKRLWLYRGLFEDEAQMKACHGQFDEMMHTFIVGATQERDRFLANEKELYAKKTEAHGCLGSTTCAKVHVPYCPIAIAQEIRKSSGDIEKQFGVWRQYGAQKM